MLGIRGLIAATFTPMDARGDVRLDGVGAMVDGLIDRGIAGFYIVGSTGEGVSLTTTERKDVAAEFVRATGGRIPTIIQVGHNSIREAAELATHAQEIGASAISAAPPSYFPLGSTREVIASIRPVLEAAPDIPFYYYHIPVRTGVAIDVVDLLRQVEEFPSFAGVKFTSTVINDFQAAREAAGDRFELYYGCDEMLLSALVVGARGAVGSTYNFASGLYQGIIEAFSSGDLETAARLQGRAVTLVRIVVRWGGLGAFKTLMGEVGFDCGPVRAPLRPISAEEANGMRAELRAAGIWELLD